MKFHAQNITIQAKIFVSEAEIGEELTNGGASEQEVFETLAREKIEELIPNDDVMKIYEIEFLSPSKSCQT